MTMTKTKTIERTKTTRRYDSVSKKVRKLLSATAQTFIPELCEALAKDWYPELELEQIKNDSNARNEIRNRMFMDWGDENKVLSDNLWKDSTINLYFPDWLRNPMRQSDSITEHLRRANEIKIAKKTAISNQQKQKLEELATKLPDTVIIPEQKPIQPKYTPLDDEELDKELHSLQMDNFGETGQSLRELYGDITHHSDGLFKTLTQKEMPYADNVDLIVDYIKPSREYWKSLMLEFDETKRTRVHNELSFLAELIEDRLELLKQVQ